MYTSRQQPRGGRSPRWCVTAHCPPHWAPQAPRQRRQPCQPLVKQQQRQQPKQRVPLPPPRPRPAQRHYHRLWVSITALLCEPRHDKTCLREFPTSQTQTGLRIHRSWLESWNFGYRIKRYYTIYGANNKDADQTARMRRLICAFVVRIWHKTHFPMPRLMLYMYCYQTTGFSRRKSFKKFLNKWFILKCHSQS